MAEFPKTLEAAIAQAVVATKAAVADGNFRLQVELMLPELKPMVVAEQFLPVFEEFGSQFTIFFPDAGAAALARRDWGKISAKITDVGTGKLPVQQQILPEDRAFLCVAPSAVEVAQVEKMCEEAGDRPFVMLNPQLEDVAIVGIGYAARKVRDRFLSTIESCYYLRPLEGAALFRCYPDPWQVWLETEDDYQLLTELPKKPVGEELEQVLTQTNQPDGSPTVSQVGFLTSLQRFLRSLSR